MNKTTRIIGLFLVALICIPTLSYAEMYKWTDKRGTTYFTDDISKVPDQYRDQQATTPPDTKPAAQKPIPVQPSSSAKPAEIKKPIVREIPMNENIQRELLATARAMAEKAETDYQTWLHIEQQLGKLMAAANNDRKNVLREFLGYCSYDMQGGAANELVEYYGFMALQAYFNFTPKEVAEVASPYSNSTNNKIKGNITELTKMATGRHWQKRHDALMSQLEKMKANTT